MLIRPYHIGGGVGYQSALSGFRAPERCEIEAFTRTAWPKDYKKTEGFRSRIDDELRESFGARA